MQSEGHFSCKITSLEETDRIGRWLAQLLPNGTTVGLVGTLGAGKTRLVQAVAVAAGIPSDDVTSPTFVLCQEYHGSRTIYHLDAYRLRDDDEFLELGPEEYFDSDAITLIEWADRVTDCLPAERIEIRLEVLGPTDRLLTVIAIGRKFNETVRMLGQYVGGGLSA